MAGLVALPTAGAAALKYGPAAMAGMGQFLGGVKSMFGQGSEFDYGDFNKQLRANYKNRLFYARKYGERYGFHPLAALGINPAMGGPMRQVTEDKGRAFANMGQGLSKMLTGQSELQKAQILEAEARANYYNAMAGKVKQPVIGGQPQGEIVTTKSGVLKSPANTGYKMQPSVVNPQVGAGIQSGPSGFFNTAQLPDGGIQVYPTQKFQESTSEGFHAMEYIIRMSGQWAKGISLDALNTPKAQMARNQLRNVQRVIEREYGGRYGYNPFVRAWYPVNHNGLYSSKSRILSKYSRDFEYGSARLVPSHKPYNPPPQRAPWQ